MQLTKYEHACFVVERDQQTLIVDPGNFTTDLLIPANVTGVIITHQHADHYDLDTLIRLQTAHPQLTIVAPQDVIDQLPTTLPSVAAAPHQTIALGTFHLQFFGGEHALIHPSLPRPHNVGVMINHHLYYPGDALVAPQVPVDTLALPVTAPWLTIGQVMDFLTLVQPRFAFPTHDAVASDTGKALVDRLLTTYAAQHDITYQRLSQPLIIPDHAA